MKHLIKHIFGNSACSSCWLNLLMVTSTMMLITSCNNSTYNAEQEPQTGELQLLGFTITTDVDIEQLSKISSSYSGDTNASLVTKSSSDDSDDDAMEHIFSVTITNLATQEVEIYYNNHTYVPTTIVLESGEYSVVAQTADLNQQIPDNDEVGFNQPRYYDKQEVTITAGEIQTISMSCKQITAGVTVEYSDMFKTLYPCTIEQEDYYSIISTNYSSEIVFLKDESQTAHFTVHGSDMEFYYQIVVKQYNSSGELEERVGEKHSFPSSAMPVVSATNYNLTIMVDGQ